jgi:hypothetical protein
MKRKIALSLILLLVVLGVLGDQVDTDQETHRRQCGLSAAA